MAEPHKRARRHPKYKTAYRVPPHIRRCAGGWFAVDGAASDASRGRHVLMAAVRGRLVRGPVTARVARLLREGASASERADPATAQLTRMGLLG